MAENLCLVSGRRNQLQSILVLGADGVRVGKDHCLLLLLEGQSVVSRRIVVGDYNV